MEPGRIIAWMVVPLVALMIVGLAVMILLMVSDLRSERKSERDQD